MKKSKNDLLNNPNSKVLILNSPEARLIAELIPNIDKVFKYMRQNVGTKNVDMEFFNEKREDYLFMLNKLNEFIEETAQEKDLKHVSKILIGEEI